MTNWITIPDFSDYLETIQIMETRVEEVINFKQPDTIYLIEYKDIYTAGTSYKDQEILCTTLNNIINTNRGGKLTYHGPGQRIIYPVINLSTNKFSRDIKKYVRKLEEWVILTLKNYGITSYSLSNNVGVWVKINNTEKKIASIGIRIKKWVAYHGIAVNINTDLENFKKIIPCGLKNVCLTSLSELGVNTTMEEFDFILQKQFYQIF